MREAPSTRARTARSAASRSTRSPARAASAASSSAASNDASSRVHVVAFDRVVRARVTGIDGPQLLPSIIDALAPVEAQLIDTDWDAAIAQVRTLTSRPSLVVLLTAQDAVGAARGFLATLPALTRDAVVLVGSVTEDAASVPDRPENQQKRPQGLRDELGGRRRSGCGIRHGGLLSST